MPKKIEISIKESLDFLNLEYSKANSRLSQDRIKALLFVKTKKYVYQSDIGKKLGRNEKTIRGWLQLYVADGFSTLIKVNSGGNNTRVISDDSIKEIENKLTDSETTITSYVELQALLEEQTGEKIIYGTLYSHCRRKYKSKLKVARKSHYKKDPNAEAFFKNPSRSV